MRGIFLTKVDNLPDYQAKFLQKYDELPVRIYIPLPKIKVHRAGIYSEKFLRFLCLPFIEMNYNCNLFLNIYLHYFSMNQN
jgi:hypothetical protein